METVHLFRHIGDGIRYSVSEFGRHSFNLHIEQAFLRIYFIRSDLKHFRHFSNNFGAPKKTKIFFLFFFFWGGGGMTHFNSRDRD